MSDEERPTEQQSSQTHQLGIEYESAWGDWLADDDVEPWDETAGDGLVTDPERS